ncbi:MAG: peptidoglycan-binding protein [Sneathiellales bacterium]|nr:peptidoglycan-binding protein [Sneathiellales bacterium]
MLKHDKCWKVPRYLIARFSRIAACSFMIGYPVHVANAASTAGQFSVLASDLIEDLNQVDVNSLQARDGYLKPRIAVAPLKAKKGVLTSAQAQRFNRRIEAALLESAKGQFVIVSRSTLPQVLEEGTRALEGDDALKRLSELNDNSQADILIIGASYNERGRTAISYQALAVESGSLLGATRTILIPDRSSPVVSISDAPLPARDVRRKEDTVLEAETLLVELGYEPGPVDGIITSQTRQALSNYQRDSALPVNGRLTRAVVKNMRRDRR